MSSVATNDIRIGSFKTSLATILAGKTRVCVCVCSWMCIVEFYIYFRRVCAELEFIYAKSERHFCYCFFTQFMDPIFMILINCIQKKIIISQILVSTDILSCKIIEL